MYRVLDQAEIARLLLDGRAYRAIAVAHATRVSEASTWTTPRGDSLVANAGDWWVMDGQQRRAVAGDVFALTYESVGGGLYRKLVTVKAVSVDTPFSLQTREGRASGAAGDWLVRNPTGESWPVAHADFVRLYEPVADGT